MKNISSGGKAHYKEMVGLGRSSRAPREAKTNVVDGVHLVQAYIQRFASEPLQLFIKRSAQHHPEIAALSAASNSVMLLDDVLFDRAAPVQSPIGILAIAPRPRGVGQTAAAGFHVLLDGVQDPGNLGAIIRSAAATGTASVHLSSACADPWSPKALRGGMGAQFVVGVEQHDDLNVAASALGVRLIACVAHAPSCLFDADLRGPAGFILGGEGAGISTPLLRQAHQLLRIPMSEGVESLNAAAAASVIFYERFRQNTVASSALRTSDH